MKKMRPLEECILPLYYFPQRKEKGEETASLSYYLMNFLNLEYFLTVARELNITKAAAELKVSQQALSKHILNLERELNLQLFERGKQLSLTDAGVCFVSYASKILALKSQMLSQISDITEKKDRNIRIGVTEARSPVYLPRLLARFCQSFPEARIHLTENNSEQLFEDLQNDKLDMVIGIEPHDKVNFTSRPLCNEDYVIMAVPEVLERYLDADALRKIKLDPESTSLADFRHCPFLCFGENLRIGRIFHNACREIGFRPNIVIESKNMYTLIHLCSLGVGATVCPKVYLEIAQKQSDMMNTVMAFPVRDIPIQTKIMLTIQRDRYASKLTREFIKIANEEFSFPSHGE